MCYFYILYSQTINRFYLGHTCDAIDERLRRHNSSHKGYTGKVSDWALKYKEAFSTKEAAYMRERQVKSYKSRKMMERIISSAG